MNPILTQPFIQIIAWLVALIELIMGFYLLILNPRQKATRHVSGLLLLLAVNSYVIGRIGSTSEQTGVMAFLFSAFYPAIYPATLVTSIAILKPNLWKERWRWLLVPLYGSILLPSLLATIDLNFGTSLWYSGFKTSTIAATLINPYEFIRGALAPFIHGVFIDLPQVINVVLLLQIAWLDKKSPPSNKQIAWVLAGATIFLALIAYVLTGLIFATWQIILITSITFIAYTYACFQYLISGRRLLQGRIQTRLIWLVLASIIPILIAVNSFLTSRARLVFEQQANEKLSLANALVSADINNWIDSNADFLQELLNLPEVSSLDASSQKEIFSTMVAIHPQYSLVTTIDSQGDTIARSDRGTPANYRDQPWFNTIMQGATIAFSTATDTNLGKPVLLVALPIKNPEGKILGAGLFTCPLEIFAQKTVPNLITENGISYVVNESNRVIAIPNTPVAELLQDVSDYPPVLSLRSGETGLVQFQDHDSIRWRAYVNKLDNSWGVIVQIQESQLMKPYQTLQRVSWTVLLTGILLMAVFAWFTIRNSLRPINILTETASAIAGGDLSKVSSIDSDDELGELSRAINNVTGQVRELITNLERRVVDRTRDLERRTIQLKVTADVARETASIHNLEELLDHTVRLISERFGFYHCGIFLIDDVGEYAILRAASSEGGQRMLTRQHKLKVGEVGIVGYTAGKGFPRIALDVGADAVYFNNPDLPRTRSEMALPLIVRNRVIGVLDVQSTKASAFTEEDISSVQILADQIALAIDNARLLQESQSSLQEIENLYAKQIGQAWREYLAEKPIAYAYDRVEVKMVPTPAQLASEDGEHIINLPITLRGHNLGSLQLKREKEQNSWSPDEVDLVKNTLSHLALALENARLLEANRQRAQKEQIIGEITSKLQSSLSLETVMKQTVQQIGETFGAAKVQIKLEPEIPTVNPSRDRTSFSGDGGG